MGKVNSKTSNVRNYSLPNISGITSDNFDDIINPHQKLKIEVHPDKTKRIVQISSHEHRKKHKIKIKFADNNKNSHDGKTIKTLYKKCFKSKKKKKCSACTTELYASDSGICSPVISMEIGNRETIVSVSQYSPTEEINATNNQTTPVVESSQHFVTVAEIEYDREREEEGNENTWQVCSPVQTTSDHPFLKFSRCFENGNEGRLGDNQDCTLVEDEDECRSYQQESLDRPQSCSVDEYVPNLDLNPSIEKEPEKCEDTYGESDCSTPVKEYHTDTENTCPDFNQVTSCKTSWRGIQSNESDDSISDTTVSCPLPQCNDAIQTICNQDGKNDAGTVEQSVSFLPISDCNIVDEIAATHGLKSFKEELIQTENKKTGHSKIDDAEVKRVLDMHLKLQANTNEMLNKTEVLLDYVIQLQNNSDDLEEFKREVPNDGKKIDNEIRALNNMQYAILKMKLDVTEVFNKLKLSGNDPCSNSKSEIKAHEELLRNELIEQYPLLRQPLLVKDHFSGDGSNEQPEINTEEDTFRKCIFDDDSIDVRNETYKVSQCISTGKTETCKEGFYSQDKYCNNTSLDSLCNENTATKLCYEGTGGSDTSPQKESKEGLWMDDSDRPVKGELLNEGGDSADCDIYRKELMAFQDNSDNQFDPLLEKQKNGYFAYIENNGRTKKIRKDSKDFGMPLPSNVDSGNLSDFLSHHSTYMSLYESVSNAIQLFRRKVSNKDKTNNKKSDHRSMHTDILKMFFLEKHLKEKSKAMFFDWVHFTPCDVECVIAPGLDEYREREQRTGHSLSLREKMSFEWLRFVSFADTYTGNGSGLKLAQNGFYHDQTGGLTYTECFACGMRYKEWNRLDDVGFIHSSKSPDCPHVLNNNHASGNVPIRNMPTDTAGTSDNQRTTVVTASETSSALCEVNISSATGHAAERNRLTTKNERPKTLPETVTQSRERQMEERAIAERSPYALQEREIDHIPRPLQDLIATTTARNISALRSCDNEGQSSTFSPPMPRKPSPGASSVSSSAACTLDCSSLVSNADVTEQRENACHVQNLVKPLNNTQIEDDTKGHGNTIQERQGHDQTLHDIYAHAQSSFISSESDLDNVSFCANGTTTNFPTNKDGLPMKKSMSSGEESKANGKPGACASKNKKRKKKKTWRKIKWKPSPSNRENVSSAKEQNMTKMQPSTSGQSPVIDKGSATEHSRINNQTPNAGQTGMNCQVREQAVLPTGPSHGNDQSEIPSLFENIRRQNNKVQTASSSGTPRSASRTQDTRESLMTSSVSTPPDSESNRTEAERNKNVSQNNKASGKNSTLAKNAKRRRKTKQDASCLDLTRVSSSKLGSPEMPEPGSLFILMKDVEKLEKSINDLKTAAGQNQGADSDLQSLKDENTRLRDMQMCKICMENPLGVTFLPCGHLACCEKCAPNLKKCPICREMIKGTVKTFAS